MAKQNDTYYSAQDKCDYYKKRVNDSKLTDSQRKYAQMRLNSLCGGKKSKGKTVTCPTCNTSVPVNSGKYTDAQKFAYGAGIGYGAAKSNKRMPVRDENKDSFRAGYKKGKTLK